MARPTTTPPVETYYDLLAVKPKATPREVEIAFRRYVARYRPTLNVEQLFTDPHFMRRLNAFLTLTGEHRTRHDQQIAAAGAVPAKPVLPTPWAEFDEHQRLLLTTRIALWRREHIEGIHLLRAALSKDDAFADGWAMLGEFFLAIDRLEEGHGAYERAVAAAPEQADYAARLQHIEDVIAGRTELQVEMSPEEEMLREERRQRLGITIALACLGLLAIGITFLHIGNIAIRPVADALYVPWRAVITQSLGMLVLFLGLSYGRIMEPFERNMLWTSMSAGDRGSMRSYPYALIILVTAVPCLWLSVIALLIIAFLDDEWPVGPSIMLGACAILTLLTTYAVYLQEPQHWTGAIMTGGNALVLAAMLGWWFGSLDRGQFE